MGGRVGLCNVFFEDCSAFTPVTACTLAKSPSDPLRQRLQPLRYLHDCSDCFRLERLRGGTCIDWKTPPLHGAHPVQTTKTNVSGAINMLGLAKRLRIRSLQASTSEVYGDPDVHPQTESYWGRVNPIGLRSCYDEGKRCAETLFFDYHLQLGFDIKVVRNFNTYGPRMHPNDGRVVSNFIMQALRGDDITVYGERGQTRSFCYVDNLVDVMFRMMQSEKGFAGPVNIGNPGEFTIRELAEKVLSLTGSKSKLVFKPLPSDDPMQRQPDISVARTKLGWEPKVALEDGLKETIRFFRTLLDD